MVETFTPDPRFSAISRVFNNSVYHPGVEFNTFAIVLNDKSSFPPQSEIIDYKLDIYEWCKKQFGQPMVSLLPFMIHTNRRTWYMDNDWTFYFRDKSDAVLFKMVIG
jgi:hypothetical protein